MTVMNKILGVLLIVFIAGCRKEAIQESPSGTPQTVEFDISAKQDYGNYPDNYYVNIKLELWRSARIEDVPVWDTVIRKMQVKSLQPFKATHLIKSTNESTGVISAVGILEYFYDDKDPFWSEAKVTKLDYNKQSHLVQVKF